MKRITIREILLGAVSYTFDVAEECLKHFKSYELRELLNIANEQKGNLEETLEEFYRKKAIV